MAVGVVRANRWRAGVVILVAAGLVLSGCTSDPVAAPSKPLTMQSDQSVLAPTSAESSSSVAPPSKQSGPQSLPPSSGTGETREPPRTSESTGTTDDDSTTYHPTSPGPSTVSSTVQTTDTGGDTGTGTDESTATPRPPTSPPMTSGAPTPKPTTSAPTKSGGSAPEEAANRKAVEAAWVKYWAVYTNIMEVPKAERRIEFSQVAVDPQLARMIREADIGDKNGLGNFGTAKHRFQWASEGTDSDANFTDCMDLSNWGIIDRKNKKLLSIGDDQVNFKITMTRSTSSTWKVVGYVEREGAAC